MKLIFIYGPPAVGKLTVARELSQLTNFPVFHNHATVDLVLSLFDFGTPSFIEIRERIWLDIMEEAARAKKKGLIFTFAPERSVKPDFVDRLIGKMKALKSEVLFVELTCPEAVVEARMSDPSREEFKKLRSLELYRKLRDDGFLTFSAIPNSGLSIDTSKILPKAAAKEITEHFGL